MERIDVCDWINSRKVSGLQILVLVLCAASRRDERTSLR